MQLAFGCQATLIVVTILMDDESLIEYSVELVVARHEEDLRWLRRVPEAIRTTIYNKGLTPALPEGFELRQGSRVLTLPNVGREAHSYLTHFVECYDSLALVTVFCQGRPFDHAPDFHDILRCLAKKGERSVPFRWYGFLDESDDLFGRRLFVPWNKNLDGRELSTGRLFEQLFGEPSPHFFYFRGGAQFAVTREAVHERPREFYVRAMELSLSINDAAHSLERFWDRLFGNPVIDPAHLGADGVRYWKRIRRIEEGGKVDQPHTPDDSV